MQNSYQTTRHLTVAFDAGSGPLDMGQGARYLFHNALTGTRMVAGDEFWPVLEQYHTPRPLGDSPLEQRAAQANILWPVTEEVTCTELLERFQEVAKRVLSYRSTAPGSEAGELVEQLKSACRPLKEFEEPVHYLWRDPERLFHIMLNHFAAYAKYEVGVSQVAPMVSDFVRHSLGRPERNGEFAQQLCTLHTSLDRARLIAQQFPAPARFLVLGDDDLMSLALTQEEGYQVDVFEIDRSLVRFIKKRAGSSVKVYSRDLTNGLPEEFHGLYDAVLADPPYNIDGMAWFIECCAAGLKENEASRLYLSTYPDLLESSERFFQEFSKNGLRLLRTTEHFNRYPFPAETHQITGNGLTNLGYHPKLVEVLMSVPYLYAHLYECGRS
jgi:hypothetical protein